ncbi:hypothetical protein LPW11_18015 [Geomonas sp. RF6]|uniref:hypothetical protein n=1 Tax=Geomonas sp. RF6 TaxID=2897342 RepID=UPI001E44B2D2|nr:hypothetical protein [Geomonas sp. RF6]UFS69774.1 hypothetical protein LPW11_18015 [Geomonas sp. RF6]
MAWTISGSNRRGKRQWKALLAAAALTLVTGCGGGGSSTPAAITMSPTGSTAADQPFRELVVGVGTHIGGQDIDKNIAALTRLGVSSVRDDFFWSGLEKVPGELQIPDKLQRYNAMLEQSGISQLVILDYGNRFYDDGGKPVTDEGIRAFARYAGYVASQVATTSNIEIWNEWDNGKEPKSAESYLKLVKAVSPAIKAARKDAVILGGSVTTAGIRNGWAVELVRGGILDYVDGVSIHPYVHCDRDSRPEAWIRLIDETAGELQRANAEKEVPLYITEMSWPSHSGACGNSAETVAKYSARALLLVRTIPSVRGIWWYDLTNDGMDPQEREQNFGLLQNDYTPKPAFPAFADAVSAIKGAKRVTRLLSPSGVVCVEIEDQGGEKVFALWADNGRAAEIAASIESKEGAALATLVVGTGARQPLPAPAGRAVITIDDTPRLLFGVQKLALAEVIWK